MLFNQLGRLDQEEMARTSCVIYIQQIPSTWTAIELREEFSSFGKIMSCDAPSERGAEVNIGQAYVIFSKPEEARKARDAFNNHAQLDEKTNQTVVIKVGLVPVSKQQSDDPRSEFKEPTDGEIVSAVATIQKAQNPLGH